jgi:hypothetical protein
LKPWFRKRHDDKTVHPESVCLEPTGQSNEYWIYTGVEWAAKAARGGPTA